MSSDPIDYATGDAIEMPVSASLPAGTIIEAITASGEREIYRRRRRTLVWESTTGEQLPDVDVDAMLAIGRGHVIHVGEG